MTIIFSLQGKRTAKFKDKTELNQEILKLNPRIRLSLPTSHNCWEIYLTGNSDPTNSWPQPEFPILTLLGIQWLAFIECVTNRSCLFNLQLQALLLAMLRDLFSVR